MLWEFVHHHVRVPEGEGGAGGGGGPPAEMDDHFDPFYPELVLRGLSHMVPKLQLVLYSHYITIGDRARMHPHRTAPSDRTAMCRAILPLRCLSTSHRLQWPFFSSIALL